MDGVHRLSRADARRLAVRAQRLTARRPADVLDAVRALCLLQLDPTSAIAPSADLVLFSRLGPDYDPQDLRDAVDEQRLLEYRGTLRPREDLALLRAQMAQWPGAPLTDWKVRQQDWLAANDGWRRELLALLRADGPLPQSQLPDLCANPWVSTGWNHRRNLAVLLDLMVQRGEVAVAGWEGGAGGAGARERRWDLAERVYPEDPGLSAQEALALRDERRLAGLGIARPRGPVSVLEPLETGAAGEPAQVEGVRGSWRVDAALLHSAPPAQEARVALLSPFDRLLHDRRRMAELFEFDYVLEMFKPAATRRWGYYALPILSGDRLVGKLDAAADRGEGVLRVHAVHEDEPFAPRVRAGVEAELAALAQWLGLALERA